MSVGDGRRVRLRPAASPAEWDGLLDRSPGATPFHRWRWLTTQADVNGWRFVPLVVVADGVARGLAPQLLVRCGPFLVRAHVPFPYVGPLVPAALLPATSAALVSWARPRRVLVLRAEFGPSVDVAAVRGLTPGLVVGEEATLVVDLAHGSEEEFWRSAQRRARRGVARARAAGVVVRPATGEEVATWLPELLAESYGARGLPSPYSPAVGRAVWEAYGTRQDAVFLAASVRGRPAGLLVALTGGDTVHAWAGGGFRAVRDDQPNALLHTELVCWALAHGYRRLDLVGSVDPGVVAFKRSFGAQEEPYAVATSAPGRGLRLVRRVRRVRGRAHPPARPS